MAVIQTDSWGDVYYDVDFNQPPFTVGNGQVGSGEERYFQFWFRDPQSAEGSTFGLTNDLMVVFCD